MPSANPIWTRHRDERLGRYQDVLFAGLMIVVAGGSSFLVVRALVASWSALAGREDSDGHAIAWRGMRPGGSTEAAEYKHAAAGSAAAAPLDEQPEPRVDWTDLRLRWHAASALAVGGNHRDALALLRSGDPYRDELLEVTDSRHREVLAAIEVTLRGMESDPVAASEIRSAVPEHQPSIRQLSRGPPARGPPAEISLADRMRRWGDTLPEEDLLRLVGDMHCELRDRIGVSDACLKLLLESCFPPGSLAGKQYFETVPRGTPAGSFRPPPDATAR